MDAVLALDLHLFHEEEALALVNCTVGKSVVTENKEEKVEVHHAQHLDIVEVLLCR